MAERSDSPASPFSTGLRGFIAVNSPPQAPKPTPKPAAPKPVAPPRRIASVRRGATVTPAPTTPVALTREDTEDLTILLEAFRDFRTGA